MAEQEKTRELSSKANALVVSYRGIRRAVGFSGLLLPIVLGPIGWILGIEIQDNMSSYYHTPLRDVFVGTLCGMGVFLFVYRGHDWIEDWTANIAGAAALAVAFFPLDENSDPLVQKSIAGYMHTLSGGVFFLTLAFYSLVHFPKSKSQISESEPHPWERNFFYRTSGIVIVLAMIAMGSYMFLVPRAWKTLLNDYNFLFWMEWLAVWSFAAAWLTKGRVIIAEIAVELFSLPRELLGEKIRELSVQRHRPLITGIMTRDNAEGAQEQPNQCDEQGS